MKKSFALILCLVFVIYIALVTCVAFIPMNVTQVASADTDSLHGEILYKLSDLTFSDITIEGNGSSSGRLNSYYMRFYDDFELGIYTSYSYMNSYCTVSSGAYATLCLIWYTSDYQSQNCKYFGYFGGVARSQFGFSADGWYYGNYVWDNAWNLKYTTKYALGSSFFDNDNCGIYFTGEPNYASASCFNTLHQFLTPAVLSDAPVFSLDSITFNYSPVVYNGEHGFSGASDDYSVMPITAFEIENAAGHENQYDEVYIDVTYYFVGSPQSSVYSIPLLMYDNKYYLALTIPFNDQEHLLPIIPSGYEPLRLTIKFHDGDDYITIAPFGDNRNDIFVAYRQNYWSTLSNGSYVMGFNAGVEYGAENAQGNNLINLIWNVFQMPFTLLFGTYNNTTHTYDGGLFNLTILGLDIRAFILSVMSVCLIIACIKIILGARGSYNG